MVGQPKYYLVSNVSSKVPGMTMSTGPSTTLAQTEISQQAGLQ